MADLSVTFAGIKSPNPFWLASAPPTDKAYNVNRAFEAGWGGVVWKTLGEAGPPVVNVNGPRYGALLTPDRRLMGFNNIELITDRDLEINLREIREVKREWADRAMIVCEKQEAKIKIYNKWMDKLGADWHPKEPMPRVKIMLKAIEYSYFEKFQFQSAAQKSFKILYPDLKRVDLFNQVKKVQVPVYFALGKFDFRTPSELALQYLDSLEAPVKKWKWFENSAHFPQLEEPKEFCSFLVNTILKDIEN